MSDEQRLVAAFHQAFDSVIGTYPAIPDDATCALRFGLIQEEFDELRTAFAQRDIAEVAKELADLLYVVYGTAVSCGIDMAPVFEEVHRSNMSKVGGRKRADGKWLKPPNYRPAQLQALLIAQGMPHRDGCTVGACQGTDGTRSTPDSQAPVPLPPKLPLPHSTPSGNEVVGQTVEASPLPTPVPPSSVHMPAMPHLSPDAAIPSTPSGLDGRPGQPERHDHTRVRLECPRCRKRFVRRSHRQGLKERLLSWFYVYPFRCQICAYRFRSFQFRARYTKHLIDRRQYERLPVHFPVAFAEAIKPGQYRTGTGTVTDLSLGGCFLYTGTRLTEGALLSLELQPEMSAPVLTIEAAIVRSARPRGVGLEFLRLTALEHERLSTLMRRLHAAQDDLATVHKWGQHAN